MSKDNVKRIEVKINVKDSQQPYQEKMLRKVEEL